MVRVLTVNAGSSSVRLGLHEAGGDAPVELARWRGPADAQPLDALAGFLQDSAPDAVAHRVVHGGTLAVPACVVDAGVEQAIEAACALAPLHNPRALAWLRAARTLLPAVPHIAVLDTGFFADLPEAAWRYALPRALADAHGIRRYGFHGTAHRALWSRWCALAPRHARGGRVITFQLGAGASVAAIAQGRPVDTSMGFTPLEGLVMATRTGDLDPGALLHLQRVAGLDADRLETLLYHDSGLAGLAAEPDMARLLARTDAPARVAVEIYVRRARKYLGAYLALLGGADGIVFGGGVGEHAPAIRAAIAGDLEWAGVALDARTNAAATGAEACISVPSSHTAVWVVPVDEAAELAAQAAALINRKGADDETARPT